MAQRRREAGVGPLFNSHRPLRLEPLRHGSATMAAVDGHGPGTAGGLALRRQEKKMTATAINTIPALTHRVAAPNVSADCGSLLPNMLMSAPGMKLIRANMPPMKMPNSPGQPHASIATTVARMAVVLGFMAPQLNGEGIGQFYSTKRSVPQAFVGGPEQTAQRRKPPTMAATAGEPSAAGQRQPTAGHVGRQSANEAMRHPPLRSGLLARLRWLFRNHPEERDRLAKFLSGLLFGPHDAQPGLFNQP